MQLTYLGVELELNDGAHGSVNLVGEVLQASVLVGNRHNLNHELARWWWRGAPPVGMGIHPAGHDGAASHMGGAVW